MFLSFTFILHNVNAVFMGAIFIGQAFLCLWIQFQLLEVLRPLKITRLTN